MQDFKTENPKFAGLFEKFARICRNMQVVIKSIAKLR